jgi:hypothetical protein
VTTRIKLSGLSAIGLSTLILMIPAILNGFPFLFPDSGDYLVFTPRLYRSPYYGLLIFFFHINRWIWGPVIAQSAIVAHLIYVLVRHGSVQKSVFAVVIICGLLLFSSLPFFTGFIMADIFTSVMIICFYVLCFQFDKLNKVLRFYLLALATVATTAHVSNLILGVYAIGLLAVLYFWTSHSLTGTLRRMGILAIPIGLSAAAILAFNVTIFDIVALTPAGPDFMMANMVQYGPARSYLKSVCPSAGYKICPYVDRLPQTADQLLWTTGIFDQLGGFTAMKDESKTIVAETIMHDPGAVIAMVRDNFLAGLVTHEPGWELRSNYQVPSMSVLLKEKFGSQTLREFLNSAEMRDEIPHGLLHRIDDVLTPLMFLFLIGLGSIAAQQHHREQAALALFLILAVLGDTLLCTAVSGVHDRYQARVTWLLPLGVFVITAFFATRHARAKPKQWPGLIDEGRGPLVLLFYDGFERRAQEGMVGGLKSQLRRVLRYTKRSLMRQQVRTGFYTAFLALRDGVACAGCDVRVNDFAAARKYPAYPIGIAGYPTIIDKVASLSNPCIFGPGDFGYPRESAAMAANPRMKNLIQPSSWFSDIYRPYCGDKMITWFAGIDTTKWPDASTHMKDLDFLIYDKIRWNRDGEVHRVLDRITHHLDKTGRRYKILRYGHHHHSQFLAILKHARAMIFVCEHETQGLAYQEAMAMNVPVLAWDEGVLVDPALSAYQTPDVKVSSVPYFDTTCGMIFKIDQFEEICDTFWQRVATYRPRRYVETTLSLELSGKRYLETYSSLATLS